MIIGRDGKRYLSYKEYGDLYGLKEEAVRQRVHRGTLWMKKIDGQKYIAMDDIPEFRVGRPKGAKDKKKRKSPKRA